MNSAFDSIPLWFSSRLETEQKFAKLKICNFNKPQINVIQTNSIGNRKPVKLFPCANKLFIT